MKRTCVGEEVVRLDGPIDAFCLLGAVVDGGRGVLRSHPPVSVHTGDDLVDVNELLLGALVPAESRESDRQSVGQLQLTPKVGWPRCRARAGRVTGSQSPYSIAPAPSRRRSSRTSERSQTDTAAVVTACLMSRCVSDIHCVEVSFPGPGHNHRLLDEVVHSPLEVVVLQVVSVLDLLVAVAAQIVPAETVGSAV
jgi:hypothetical protein